MSQSVINAIERARVKRARKLAQWWGNQVKDPAKVEQIKLNQIEFNRGFAVGIPLESIPLPSPEPPLTAE